MGTLNTHIDKGDTRTLVITADIPHSHVINFVHATCVLIPTHGHALGPLLPRPIPFQLHYYINYLNCKNNTPSPLCLIHLSHRLTIFRISLSAGLTIFLLPCPSPPLSSTIFVLLSFFTHASWHISGAHSFLPSRPVIHVRSRSEKS